MRAGCFAEDRVIDLINRRFVPFYYCTGGPGLGQDDAAREFVGEKTDNPWAFLAVFDEEGQILGESALYADKDETFEFLRRTLGKHPGADRPSTAEASTLRDGRADAASPAQQLAAAALHEELGQYGPARRLYSALVDEERSAAAHVEQALLGLLRIHRHLDNWESHEHYEHQLRELCTPAQPSSGAAVTDAAETHDANTGRLTTHADVEAGYRWIAQRRFAEARALLQRRAAVETATPTEGNRLAELHFYAGVACWFDGDRDWAKFHWCWVAENLPDDRLCRRAYIAAAAEVLPYANPELDGFKIEARGCGTGTIVRGYQSALTCYVGLFPKFAVGDLTGGFVTEDGLDIDRETDPSRLVRELCDSNECVKVNNHIVDRLIALGETSIAPALAAFENRDFIGRGYALWAASKVMQATGARPEHGLACIRRGLQSENRYVKAISRSCRTILSQSSEATTGRPKTKPVRSSRSG